MIFFLEKKIKNSVKSSEVVSFFLIRKMITREKNVLARGQIKSKNRESFFSLKMSRTIYFEIIVTMGNKKNILFLLLLLPLCFFLKNLDHKSPPTYSFGVLFRLLLPPYLSEQKIQMGPPKKMLKLFSFLFFHKI